MNTRSFVYESTMPTSAENVYHWHEREGAFERLVPPGQPVTLVQKDPGLDTGVKVVIRMGKRPFCLYWHAEHIDCKSGRSFTDKQMKGPCSFWEHTHEMIPLSENDSVLREIVQYRIPFGINVDHKLEELFQYRHKITREDLLVGSDFPLYYQRIGVLGKESLLKQRFCSLLNVLGYEIHDSPPFDALVFFGNSQATQYVDSELIHISDHSLTEKHHFKRYVQLIPSNILWKSTGLLKRLSRIPCWKRGLFRTHEEVQWIYLDDAVYGIFFALASQSLEGEYTLANPEMVQLRDLYDLYHSNSPFSWSLNFKSLDLKKVCSIPSLHSCGAPLFNQTIERI